MMSELLQTFDALISIEVWLGRGTVLYVWVFVIVGVVDVDVLV